MLRDQASSVSGAEKETVESDLKTLKSALSGTDLDAIKSATERLAVGVQELGKKLYETAAATASANAGTAAGDGGGYSGATSGNGAADEEVVDAEIVDEAGQS